MEQHGQPDAGAVTTRAALAAEFLALLRSRPLLLQGLDDFGPAELTAAFRLAVNLARADCMRVTQLPGKGE